MRLGLAITAALFTPVCGAVMGGRLVFTPKVGGLRTPPRDPDPTFGAIEAHRRAMALCLDAMAKAAALPPGPELDSAQALADGALEILDLVRRELVDVQPTTWPGLSALLSHVAECSRRDEAQQRKLPALDSNRIMLAAAKTIERLERQS